MHPTGRLAAGAHLLSCKSRVGGLLDLAHTSIDNCGTYVAESSAGIVQSGERVCSDIDATPSYRQGGAPE